MQSGGGVLDQLLRVQSLEIADPGVKMIEHTVSERLRHSGPNFVIRGRKEAIGITFSTTEIASKVFHGMFHTSLRLCFQLINTST